MLKTTLKNIIKQHAPRWLVLIIDLNMVSISFVLAYLVRFNFQLSFDTAQFFKQIPLVLFAALISFLLIGSYKGIIRHTGIKDSMNVANASFALLVLLTAFVSIIRNFNLLPNFSIPISILVIHFLINILLLIASRFTYKKIYYLLTSDFQKETRVLIYGAGDAGCITYNVLKEDKALKVQVIGFVDDDPKKNNKSIFGLPIYSSKQLNSKLILSLSIDEIIISIQKIKSVQLMEIVNQLSKLPAKIKIVPPAEAWINNNITAQQIKPLQIEDLLGRATIQLDKKQLENEFNKRVILITGAAGSIGSELAKQVASYRYAQLILVDQAESQLYTLQQFFVNQQKDNMVAIVADVSNADRMDKIFKTYQPEIIYHAAAYKHVPFMEENPYESIRVNVMGTKILADLALKYNVQKFVMVSTDKAVNPTNIMGATKRIAEMYTTCVQKNSKTKFITTRFGNVLGSNGSVIPLFQEQLKNGGPLTVTHRDIMRYFMTIPEACQLVLEAGTMGNGGEIFVFDMGESVKIFDLAVNMIKLSGLNYPKDIDITITGLRPGEKLYEELLASDENTLPTYHEKIMIAKVSSSDNGKTQAQIEKLIDMLKTEESMKLVSKMKDIVPEFISNNSVYQELDTKKKASANLRIA